MKIWPALRLELWVKNIDLKATQGNADNESSAFGNGDQPLTKEIPRSCFHWYDADMRNLVGNDQNEVTGFIFSDQFQRVVFRYGIMGLPTKTDTI